MKVDLVKLKDLLIRMREDFGDNPSNSRDDQGRLIQTRACIGEVDGVMFFVDAMTRYCAEDNDDDVDLLCEEHNCLSEEE